MPRRLAPLRRILTCAAVLAWALGWAAPIPSPRAAEAGAQDAAYAGRMIARVNWHRARAGLAPISPDAALGRAAAAHALAMANGDFFAHESPDGSGFAARAGRAGYRWRLIAENISAGQATPEATVDGWMDSEGHRRNMLTGPFRDAGVGYAVIDPDPGEIRYGHYWVLMLGAPADSGPGAQ